MLRVNCNGHEMEGSSRWSYARFYPSLAAKGWKGHIFPRLQGMSRTRCGVSGLEASGRHAAFWQVFACHMVELAREPRFPEGRIRGCYVEQKGQGC
jgi:hypothetical protein